MDIGLIFAARERARQKMLDERRKKAQRERIEKMKNRVVEKVSFAALERAIDRIGMPHRSSGARTVLSTVPLRNSRFNVLNMKPRRRIQKPYTQRPRLRQRAHAAKSFRKFQKKELVPPPVEEFVRSNEDQGRAFAIENEMREIVRQRMGSHKIKTENVDHHSVKKELGKEVELQSIGREEMAVTESRKTPIQVTTPIHIARPVETTTSTTTSKKNEVSAAAPTVVTIPTTTTPPILSLESEKMEVKFIPQNKAEKEAVLVVEQYKEKDAFKNETDHGKNTLKDQWKQEESILEKMQREEHNILENQRIQEQSVAVKETVANNVNQKEEKVNKIGKEQETIDSKTLARVPGEKEQETPDNKTLKSVPGVLPEQEEAMEDEEDQETPTEEEQKAEDNETVKKDATQKITENEKKAEASDGENNEAEVEGEETAEVGNMPIAHPPNMREVTFGQRPYNMAGNGPRYINILLEGEMEFVGLVDRVAYSPLAEARAIVSNHESPAGVHVVRVQSESPCLKL
ncbi:hypothetical protein ANCCAN_24799 [Ancylostoma caninum]|uniref:Uncharacterized protein n=1 Tax=Ancylostoma caninum TaxID=29170 RepID=A0A368FBJ4_ANCCA|nr:hypothetical protein ANCCAN_24799 [Ancylostoma caninum]